ncbi:MAG TPA: hypothetical protein V6D18_02840, partial [Thermosynechococcaceae cyanobacterium]
TLQPNSPLLLAPALRGQWNNQVDDYIHRNLQHPTGWIKLLTGKGTKLTNNQAIAELVGFYCDTWRRFGIWEQGQQSPHVLRTR